MPIFLAPLYLAGALLAAAPVVMHLLQRRKPKPVNFSTIRFLRTAVAKTRRSRRVTQVLTLLMRVLILLLLALAFARPKLRYAQWLPHGSRTVVIVLDASASSHARHGDIRVFDVARDWALNLLGTLERGDRVAVWIAGLETPAVVFPPVTDHHGVAGAVRESQPGFASVNVVTTLYEVLERLEFGAGYTGLEVHVFSDFSNSSWDSARAEDLNQALAERPLALFFNHVAPAVIPNAGFAEVTFNPPALIGEGHLTTRAVVRASADFDGHAMMRKQIHGVEAGTRSFALGRGGRTTVTLPAEVAATDSGADAGVSGILTLSDDPYPLDNTFYFSLPRVTGVPVMLVDGSDDGGARRDTFFLRHAIQPGSRSETILAPETVGWSRFLAADLSGYQVVLLSNPPSLEGAVAAKLEAYMNTGGNVVIFPGPPGDVYGGLSALEPFDGMSVGLHETPEPATESLLVTTPPGRLEQRAVNALPPPFEVAPRKRLVFGDLPPGVEAAFLYADGTPFIVFGEHGNGSIAVASLGATREWSDWPLTPLFVVAVQELTRRAVDRNLQPLTTMIGEVFAVPWPLSELEADFHLTLPDGATRVMTLTRKAVTDPFLVTQFEQPGFHQLSRGERVLTIAVNVPLSEGRLDYLGADRLAGELRSTVLYQSSSWEEQRQILGAVRHGRPLWPLLLIAAFLLALGEEIFANYQSRTQELPPGLRRLLAGGQAAT